MEVTKYNQKSTNLPIPESMIKSSTQLIICQWQISHSKHLNIVKQKNMDLNEEKKKSQNMS